MELVRTGHLPVGGFFATAREIGLASDFRCRGYLLPLREDDIQFDVQILTDRVHFDVIFVIAEGILKLRADAINTVQCKYDQGDDGNGPPAQFVGERKRKNTAEKSENLFLVDPKFNQSSYFPLFLICCSISKPCSMKTGECEGKQAG
jgi:hypothetical protein